jgi:squalene-hopene/tetraprenyl-beta-curcumene cyclase
MLQALLMSAKEVFDRIRGRKTLQRKKIVNQGRSFRIPEVSASWTQLFLSTALLSVAITSGCSRPLAAKQPQEWSRNSAATYLDKREAEWASWPGAARDHGTFCVSCHTALPYALARPVLSKELQQTTPSAQEDELISNVVRRVRLWDRTGPYYSDKDTGIYKTAESRGTEAVLNALILTVYDAEQGNVSPDTRTAFDHMWAMQDSSGETAGSWPWLAFGHEEPWEADDSRYYGACLAAIAVGKVPGDYHADEKNIDLLRAYLKREYSQQSIINRLALLWASSELPGLIDPQQRKTLVDEVLSKQQPDGGWQLSPLTWKWRGWTLASIGRKWILSDGSLAERRSDGYATAFIAFVLPRAGVSAENTQLKKAMGWLETHQTDAGYWPSYSVNKRRNPFSNTGRFMSDAATAYAVLALTDAGFDNHSVAAKRDLSHSARSRSSY